MTPSSHIEVNLAALDANLAEIRRVLDPKAHICAVVKADAYGLGALPIGRRLSAAGVKMLAVYSPQQAAELSNADIVSDLLILMPVYELSRGDALYRLAVAGRLHLVVHSPDQADAIERIALKFGTPLPIHLEIDTGMSRCGMSPADAAELVASLPDRRFLRLAGVFSHPSSSNTDPSNTQRQFDRFTAALRNCSDQLNDDVIRHFANTYTFLRDSRYHRSMVRIGLALLGYGVHDLAGEPRLDPLPRLQPIMRWVSHIVHTLEVPAGSTVGYDATYTTPGDSRLGIIPVGYGDGYPLALSNGGIVRVGPLRGVAPIRGRVNMDQLIVDLTELPDATIGSEVELYSDDPAAPNALGRLAELADSHCYELLCRLSPRITRRYLSNPKG
jgi:alanine racemase